MPANITEPANGTLTKYEMEHSSNKGKFLVTKYKMGTLE